MRIHANRYQGLDPVDLEDVSLTIALDVVPGPDRRLFLKIILLDLLGKPVTANVVSVNLIRDPEGHLVISAVHLGSTQSHSRYSWPWQAKFWKGRSCSDLMPKHACTSLAGHNRGGNFSSLPWTEYYTIHHDSYHANCDFLHYLRSATLPAVVGIMASLTACVVALTLTRIAVSVYFRLREWRKQKLGSPKVADVEEGPMSEMDRFLLISGRVV